MPAGVQKTAAATRLACCSCLICATTTAEFAWAAPAAALRETSAAQAEAPGTRDCRELAIIRDAASRDMKQSVVAKESTESLCRDNLETLLMQEETAGQGCPRGRSRAAVSQTLNKTSDKIAVEDQRARSTERGASRSGACWLALSYEAEGPLRRCHCCWCSEKHRLTAPYPR